MWFYAGRSFYRRHHNTIVSFAMSARNCENCTPPRRTRHRVRVEEHRGGLDVVPSFPWVTAVAWRNYRCVQRAK